MYPQLLIPIFAFVAFAYSLVGFGGGSSYIALLLAFNVNFDSIPTVALCCNIVVVSSGSFHYLKSKQVNWKFLIPFLISSIPSSYLGASLKLEPTTFKMILGIALLLSSLKMLFFRKKDYEELKFPNKFIALVLGALIGFISGIVGIGGGIFLSPVLYTFKWGHPKFIASTCCLFILFNSMSGLIGQVMKSQSLLHLEAYISLIIAVFIGGQLGSFLSSKKLSPKVLEISTGILVLIVSLRILMVV